MANDQDYLLKIVRYLNNPEDAELAAEVNSIRMESAAQETFFQEVQKLWVTAFEMGQAPGIDVDAATERLRQKLEESDRYADRFWTGSGMKWLARAAAVFVFGLVGFWGYTWFNRVEYIVLTNGNAQIDSVFLSDGTKIFLDRNSSISYPKTIRGDERKVYLQKGNAFFDVARDKSRPFIVQLNQSAVKVLGTEFNISLEQDQIHVSVREGTVMFQPEAQTQDNAVLRAGEGIVYNVITGDLKSVDAKNTNEDSWLTRALTFRDASLAEVLESLENYYKINIKVEDSIANFRKFNATFRASELQEVLDVLQATYPIEIEKQDSVLVVRQGK
jgi:transmembrane sensor